MLRVIFKLILAMLAIGGLALIVRDLSSASAHGPRVEEHTLRDGTQCAVYRDSITCNWQNNLPPTAELPPYARVEIQEGQLAWSLTP